MRGNKGEWQKVKPDPGDSPVVYPLQPDKNKSFTLQKPTVKDAAELVNALEKQLSGVKISATKRPNIVSVKGSAAAREAADLVGVKSISSTESRVLEAVGKGGIKGSNLKLEVGSNLLGWSLAISGDYASGKTNGAEFAGGVTSSTTTFAVGTAASAIAVGLMPVTAPVLLIAGAAVGTGLIVSSAWDFMFGDDIKTGATEFFRSLDQGPNNYENYEWDDID